MRSKIDFGSKKPKVHLVCNAEEEVKAKVQEKDKLAVEPDSNYDKLGESKSLVKTFELVFIERGEDVSSSAQD